MNRSLSVASGLALLLSAPLEASAHHVMGGGLPDTWVAGLLSGIGHPIIGLDHLAFVIAVGLAAAFLVRRWSTPLAFVAATVLGCVLQLAGVSLPLAEIVITGSVVLLGGMIVSGRSYSSSLLLCLFAVSGLFHGWAYGASIIGAEATPLAAYLAGFALIQYAIIVSVTWVVRSLWIVQSPIALQPRLAGAVAAGVGLAFLVEILEGVVIV